MAICTAGIYALDALAIDIRDAVYDLDEH